MEIRYFILNSLLSGKSKIVNSDSRLATSSVLPCALQAGIGPWASGAGLLAELRWRLAATNERRSMQQGKGPGEMESKEEQGGKKLNMEKDHQVKKEKEETPQDAKKREQPVVLSWN